VGGGCCAPFRGDLVHITQCRLGRGLATTVPSGILIHPAVWPQHMGRKVGILCAPFRGGGELGPHLTQGRLGRGLPPYKVASWSIRLATVQMGRKWGCCAPFLYRARSPSKTTSPGPRPTSVPSGIMIHPIVSFKLTCVAVYVGPRTQAAGKVLAPPN